MLGGTVCKLLRAASTGSNYPAVQVYQLATNTTIHLFNTNGTSPDSAPPMYTLSSRCTCSTWLKPNLLGAGTEAGSIVLIDTRAKGAIIDTKAHSKRVKGVEALQGGLKDTAVGSAGSDGE